MEIDRLFHRRHRGNQRGGDAVPPRDSFSYRNRRDASRGSDRGREGICLQRTRDGTAIKTTHSKVHTEENRQTSSLKANGVPMKTLLKAEMSKEGKPTQNSPGLIARLMGLDTLPASGPVSKSGAYSQKLIKEHSCGFNATEPEYKDVFEVGERSQTKHKSEPSNRISRRLRNTDSKRVLRHNFVGARCHEHAKGFSSTCDVTENLYSNEDSFRKFLQKPHPLIAKYFFDLDSFSSSPEPTHITVLKSSKPTELKSSEFSLESIQKCENSTRGRRNATHSKDECEPAIDNAAPKLGKKIRQKSDCSRVPTRIVVLKPSLGKIPSGSVSFPFQCSTTSSIPGHRRHKSGGSCPFLSENGVHQHYSSKIEVPRGQIQNSSETTIGIAKNRKKCRSKDSFEGVTKFDHRVQSKNNYADKAIACAHSRHLGESEYRRQEFLSHPVESFVNREARRHLSKQFSMSNGCEDVGCRDQGPSTLAEMLALSDGETSASNQMDSGPAEDYPLGISSRDGWTDIWSRQLSRSRSLPSLPNFFSDINSSWHEELYENSIPKGVLDIPVRGSAQEYELNQKLEDSSPINGNVHPSIILSDDRKEGKKKQPPCDIAATYVDNHSQNGASLSEIAVSFYDAVASAEDILYSGDKSRKSTTEFTNEELLQDAITSGDNKGDILISKIKKSESMDANPFNEPAILKVELPQVPKGAEESEPVSLLDPLDEEVLSEGVHTSSGCFQGVNSGLQSLRLQLQLLRSETASTCTEGSVVLSDEETDGSCDDLEERSRIPHFSTYEEDRDFSYVLGMLTDSGLQGASTDEIPDTCHLPDTPIDPVVFAKHERFYECSAWQRDERKLLFDLLNCILSEKIASKKMPFRSVQNARLNVEDIWTSLVRRRQETTRNLAESHLDVGWMDASNAIETIGWDVERMVADVLLDEIVSELTRGKIFGESSWL